MIDETPPPPPPRPCAICGKPRKREFAPFCSARCESIDLGRWLKGSYVIPGAPVEKDEDEAE